MDQSGPGPSKSSPVQSNLPFGLDWTEPYPRLGPSGLVESLVVSELLLLFIHTVFTLARV